MGLTSGRGGRGGARGSGQDGYPGRENDGQRGRTSLVSHDGYGQQGDNRLRGEYATRYANGQYDHDASYASLGQGDGHPRPGGRPRGDRGGRGRGRRPSYRRRAGYGRRRGISVPVIAVVATLASVAVVAAAAGVNRMLTARPAAADAPAVNVNCTLIVPADPLTAGGLAAPYQLTATDPASGPCNEANASQTAFVQGAMLDPATGKISVYDPLVIDAGTQPAVAPVVPVLPAGAVVAVWFGFNGNTLTLAGADQAQALTAQGSATAGSSSPAQGAPSSTAAASGAATATDTAPATASPAASGTDPSASPAAATQPSQGTAPASAPATATVPATPATPTAAAAAVNSAPSTDVPKAAAEAEGAAPLSPANAGSAAGYDATLTRVAGYGSSTASGRSSDSASSSAVTRSGQASQSAGSPAASVPPSGAGPAAGSAGASDASGAPGASAGTAPASGSASSSASASAGAAASPTAAAGDGPAASGTADAILQQANCVAGQNVGGQFSSFTQMGACNAAAFFSAANAAIRAGKLTVPPPGTASDGRPCLTTRSFALIDQDQSDNVTTQYLAEGNGQTAQDTAANRQAMTGAAGLFNGSDNGLLDFFVDPALGCTPWQVPDLADGGAPATALPLDELQAARYSGGRGNPAALVPLNDPMTLDNNGQFSRAKTNSYRSLVDMPPLPAGESPAAYCLNMERIQGQRLQQDVNLLIGRAGPAPDAANSLFTFLAMRLQQSFANLSCGSFGIRNVVSTTADASGVVVAACFLNHAAPLTPGSGNPMGATATCPATTADASPSGPAGQPGAGSGSPGPGSSSSSSAPAASPTPSSSARQRHYRRHHWWW